MQNGDIRIAKVSTSKSELVDLIKAWTAITIAFAVVLTGFSLSINFLIGAAIAAITVGTGFLLHELAHKFTAQRYGCFAEFKSFDGMLLLAVAMSFLGFIFAAPGAVMISGHVTKKENGIISIAGPLTNIILAIFFAAVSFSLPQFRIVWEYGFSVNIWLALFNMIPLSVLDGKKIFSWSKGIWGLTTAVILILFFSRIF